MKLVRAIVAMADVDDLRKTLDALRVGRLSVAAPRAAALPADHRSPTAEVELVVDDDRLADVVQELRRSARQADAAGRVLVLPLD